MQQTSIQQRHSNTVGGPCERVVFDISVLETCPEAYIVIPAFYLQKQQAITVVNYVPGRCPLCLRMGKLVCAKSRVTGTKVKGGITCREGGPMLCKVRTSSAVQSFLYIWTIWSSAQMAPKHSWSLLQYRTDLQDTLMHRKCLATARKYTNKNQHALCKHLGLKQITVQITSTRLVSYKQQPHAFSPVTTSTSAVPTPPPQCLCFYNIFDSKLHKHHCTYDSVVWQVQRQHISRKCTHNKSMHLPLQKLPLEPPFNLYDNEMQPVLPMTRVTD